MNKIPANIKSLADLKNAFQGQRAFIIGNGPSLSKLDMTLLKDEVTFGVNSIFYLFDEIGFKPTFYVVEDTLVAEDRASEINQLSGMIKIFGTYLDYCLEDRQDVFWSNVIFDYSDYANFPHFSRDASQSIWVGGTVSYVCMQLAYFMGFDPVYLIGFDHSYDIPADADIEGTIITSASDDPNHFHPEYFGKGKRWHLPRVDRMEQSYLKAKRIYEQDNRQIINATAGGKLEVFPRASYASLFPAPESAAPQSKEKPVADPATAMVSNSDNPPTISAIVCTHNNHNQLVSTLESLLQQTLPAEKFEVIIVDNASSDQTRAVCAGYPQFHYIFEAQAGLSHARNAGIAAASSKLLAFIDDDAEADAGWLEELVRTFESDADIWAAGGKVLPIWDAPRPAWLTEEHHRSLSLIDWGSEQRALKWPERIIGTNCAFRTQVFEQMGNFKTELGRIGKAMLGNEDTEIQERIHDSGRQVFYTPTAVVFHHVPAERMTREYLQKRDEGHQVSQQILKLRSQGQTEQAHAMADNFVRQQALDELGNMVQIKMLESARAIQQFRDIHRGQRCVIIGNGPSLNNMDLSFLKNEITFGTNRIYLGFEKYDFMPSYYLSVNPLVIEQSIDEIMQIPGAKFLSRHGMPHVPEDAENVHFLQSLDEPIFSKNPAEGVWEGYTVTYVALQLAYFMGFEEVYLIGCDHSFSTPGPANAEVTSTGDDPNHFAANYFGKGVRWHLPDLVNSEMAYQLAKLVFNADDRNVFDATVSGKLKVFPKRDHREVFLSQAAEMPASSTEQQDDTSTPAEPEFLISAIVSTYNSAALLPGCLDDLLNQTIADQLEIIVIDSGSEQDEGRIVAEYQQKHANIIYLHTERESLYQAWNRGVFAARGRYITNANADDAHRADALEKLVAALESHPEADLAYANCAWTDVPNDTFEASNSYQTIEYPPYQPALNLLYCPLGPHPVWRRSVFTRIGLFDARYRAAGDYDYLLRFTAAGLKAVQVPETLSLFYQNKQGLTLADGTSAEENGLITAKYRTSLAIDSIYQIDPLNPQEIAHAWCALGVLACGYDVPWLEDAHVDLNFAGYCFLKSIDVHPAHEAVHNLAAVLSHTGNWDGVRSLLSNAEGPEFDTLKKATATQEPIALVNITLPAAINPIIFTGSSVPSMETIPVGSKTPSSTVVPAVSNRMGFNVISYASGNLGIGVTARNVISLLLEKGYPVAIGDLDPGLGRGGKDLSFNDLAVSKLTDLPHDINLIILPPADITELLKSVGHELKLDQRLNIAFSMWELTVLPEAWIPTLESMDVLVAESDFIRHAFDFNLSNVLTITAEHPLYLPDGIAPNRSRFGLPEDDVIFITSFEPFSDPQRKNPFAVVAAFERAFGDNDSARLVLKLNNARSGKTFHPLVQELRDRCKKNPNITIFTDTLTYVDALNLYSSCDIFVSLHRSEGLGLGPMEAMALGKPVIATAWSGNMSYMDHTSACLVGYRLIPVDGTISAYNQAVLGKEALWADANVDEAAAWMQRLAADPDLRAAIGLRAARVINQHHERARAGHFLQEIEAIHDQKHYLAGAPLTHKPIRRDVQHGILKDVMLENATADIVIPIYGQAELVRKCIQSVLRTTTNAHLILVDDCSPGVEIEQLFHEFESHPQISLARTDGNQGFIGTCTLGAQLGTSPYLLFLNSDTEAIDAGWLERLLPDEANIAVVGAKLLYPPTSPAPLAGTIQHAGVSRNQAGIPYHPFIGWKADAPEVSQARDVNAVTGACLLVRRQVWQELDGWNKIFGRGVYEDVDFCWRVRAQGLRVYYNPAVRLYHYESASRGADGRHSLNEHMSDNLIALRQAWPRHVSDEELFFGADSIAGWQRAQQQLSHAHKALSEGDFNTAARVMRNAVKAAPDNPEVIVGFAQLLIQQEKHGQAIQHLHTVLTLAPTHWSARVLLVDELLISGDVRAAWEQILILESFFPGNQEITQRRQRAIALDPSINLTPATSSPAEELLHDLLDATDLPATLEARKHELDQDFLDLVNQYIDSATQQGNPAVAEAMRNLAIFVENTLSPPFTLNANPSAEQVFQTLIEARDTERTLILTAPYFDLALLDLINQKAIEATTTGKRDLAKGYQELADYVQAVLESQPGSDDQTQAEETLQSILEADDIVMALQSNPARLTPALLDLINAKITEANTSGFEELAQGLANLATFVEDHLRTIAMSPRQQAEQTLHLLLGSDDLPVALQEHSHQLTPELVELVLEHAQQEHNSGDEDIAEGFDNLALYIKSLQS